MITLLFLGGQTRRVLFFEEQGKSRVLGECEHLIVNPFPPDVQLSKFTQTERALAEPSNREETENQNDTVSPPQNI